MTTMRGRRLFTLRSCCLVAACLATAACGINPRYCDETTECGNPDQVCDFNGVCPASEGLARSCIDEAEICWDAAGPSPPDANIPYDGYTCPADEFLRCDVDNMVTCGSDGMSEVSIPCAYGCNLVAERCYDLDPSNNLGIYLDQTATAPNIVLSDGATIDTDTGAVVNGDSTAVTIPTQLLGAPAMGVSVRVLMVKSLTLNNVMVSGAAALAIVADGRIEVRGVLDLAGRYAVSTSGPGVYPSCAAGNGNLVGDDASGGGGGGFGAAGGAGGQASGVAGGTAGPVSGNATLVPLRGGCSGGTVDGASMGSFGRGGGAVQLVSRTEVAVVLGSSGGQINVAGSGGGFRGNDAGSGVWGGTGAGSGGAILLEAAIVTVTNGAGMTANGGGGGCRSQLGSAGSLSQNPAPGGDCATTYIGDGGDGGALTSPAGGDGGDILITGNTSGGGGGGGIGRIRVNTADGIFLPAGSAIISPTPSVGIVATR